MGDIEFLTDLRVELFEVSDRESDQRHGHAIRTRGRGRRFIAVALLAAVGCAAVALGVISPSGGSGQPAAPQTAAGLVKSIESGFGKSDIVAVTLGAPPAEYRDETAGPWLYVQVPSVVGADSVLASWEANLLAAAYAAQAPSLGLTPETGLFIMNSATCLTNRESTSCDESGGTINPIPEGTTKPVPFDPTSASTASLEATVTSGLASAGLQLKSISIYTVDHHPVPVVVAEAHDPTAVVSHPPTDATVFGAAPNGFEGIYLELDDSAGNPILVQSFASRIAAGIGWTAPGLQTPRR